MSTSRTVFATLAILALASSCKQENEPQLNYYSSPRQYDIVQVTPPPADNEVRNIILMIGDGMGLEQVSCAWVLNKGKLNFDNFPVVGLSRTYSVSDLITDSGAGGTALAAGRKTANDHVGVAADGSDLYSILAKAKEAGMLTGVATTCHLADATPCDFCCHNDYRYNQEDLIADYLECGVDYISGGGTDWFTIKRTDSRNIIDEMAAKGYNVALDWQTLSEAGLPVLALLAPDNLPIAAERGELYRNSVTRGIELLSQAAGDKGFCMMLEGSCIDDWLHGNDIGKAMEELLDFDRTIGDVLQWAEKDGHTLVMVTADHSTGCLTLQDGDLAEGSIGVAFGSESHNGIAVPYYVWGPGSDSFGGILENDEIGRRLANFIK